MKNAVQSVLTHGFAGQRFFFFITITISIPLFLHGFHPSRLHGWRLRVLGSWFLMATRIMHCTKRITDFSSVMDQARDT
jgi:hypothetical protein